MVPVVNVPSFGRQVLRADRGRSRYYIAFECFGGLKSTQVLFEEMTV